MATPTTLKTHLDLVASKQASITELTQDRLNHIQATQPTLNSFITITADQALERAAELDQQLAQGQALPLMGAPLVHKDNHLTKGVLTTAASHMLANYRAHYDATVVTKLAQAGAITLGKVNLDAFAHGSSTENSDFGPTKNPWHTDYVPGGSSGGSAAAVAAAQALIATGSDTGGSIRLPASYTNTVGIKSTYGRVSRYGVIAMGSSFDSIGAFTTTVEDCALVLQQMAGHDPHDSTTIPAAVDDYLSQLTQPLAGLKLGLVKSFINHQGLNPEVAQVIDQARQELAKLGVEFIDIELPHAHAALATYYILASSEISSNLARLDGIRYGHSSSQAKDLLEQYELSRAEGFGAEAKRRIMLGTYALSSGYYDAYYKKAQQVRTLVKQDFDQAFSQVDGILAPVSPDLPFKIGQKNQDPLAMYLSDILTVPVNLAGVPALAVPAGFVNNLPVGMQLIGPQLSEAKLFNWGHQYQQVTDWHARRPSLANQSAEVA